LMEAVVNELKANDGLNKDSNKKVWIFFLFSLVVSEKPFIFEPVNWESNTRESETLIKFI
jgi:hypothetical protein